VAGRFALAVLVGLVLALAPAPARAQSHFEGDLGPGSTYEIDVPAAWNHSLVLYAHGLVQAGLPLVSPSELPEFDSIRTALLSSGFAVAASSSSSNDRTLADAVRRTHQLSGFFTTVVSAPRRTLVMGASLGALVAIKLAESYALEYDGALALCGPLGGALPQVQYVGDGRVLFDYYFPGVLPGTPLSVPPETTFLSPLEWGGPSTLFIDVVTALAGSPAKTIRWASAANLPFNNMEELADSALAFLAFSLRYTNDLIERVNGKSPYDNTDTTYEVDATSDTVLKTYLSGVLNDNVARIQGDHAAVSYYERNYTPSGRIGIPVLTLHNTRDPAVPFAHEAMFGAAVAGAGRTSLLTQVPVNRWGHCAFSSAEVQSAFVSLVQWVETGIRPTHITGL
jgi:pimeloyl-ACP methyl ester carboxylesterase